MPRAHVCPPPPTRTGAQCFTPAPTTLSRRPLPSLDLKTKATLAAPKALPFSPCPAQLPRRPALALRMADGDKFEKLNERLDSLEKAAGSYKGSDVEDLADGLVDDVASLKNRVEVCVCVCLSVYLSIYLSISISISISIYIYIYIYTHTHTHTHISFIHIYSSYI